MRQWRRKSGNRFTIHYTPTHGSWLTQAEIEIGIFSRQCVGKRRIPSLKILRAHAALDSHWSNRIVPGGQGRMSFDAKATDMFWIGCGAGWVPPSVEVGRDCEPGSGACVADEVQDFGVCNCREVWRPSFWRFRRTAVPRWDSIWKRPWGSEQRLR